MDVTSIYKTTKMVYFANFTWDWRYICGPDGLRPWDDVTKDIGICFQELFLEIPVYFLLAIFSGYYIGLRKHWVVREKTQERAITLRSFIVLGLVFIPIIHLYIFISNDKDHLYPIDYFTESAKCLAWIVHFGYILALKHRLGQSSRGPLCQLVLWSIIVLFNVTSLRSTILTGSSTAYNIATLCCHVLYFLTLLPSSDSRPTFYSPCLVGSQHSHVSIFQSNHVHIPNIIFKILFYYRVNILHYCHKLMKVSLELLCKA